MDNTEDTQHTPHELDMELLGRRVSLVTPHRVHERYDVLYASNEDVSTPRLRAAALAVCWPWLRRALQQRGINFQGNVRQFGAHALDFLVERGAMIPDVLAAGQVAIGVMAHELPGIDLPHGEELQEEVGNSDDAEGSS